MYGIPPPFYQKFPLLSQWYTPLSTTLDRNGIEYISTMEGIKYPFFGKSRSSSSSSSTASRRRSNANIWLRSMLSRHTFGGGLQCQALVSLLRWAWTWEWWWE